MQKPIADLISELASALEVPDTDYWYDVGNCDALKILTAGGDELLVMLLGELQSWTDVQQEHLAYILGGTGSAAEIRLLDLLAASENQDVVFRAREALHGTRG